MPIPNLLHEVERTKADYPLAWQQAHTNSPQTEDFIRILAGRLHRIDPNFGLNGKRGNPNDISDDVVNYRGEGPGHDPTNGNTPVTVIDVIGSAGAPDAYPAWTVFSELPGPGAWVSPLAIAPPAPEPPKPTYPGDLFFTVSIGDPLAADYATAKQVLNSGTAVWFARTIWRVVNEGMTAEQSLAISRAQWRKALDPNGTIVWN